MNFEWLEDFAALAKTRNFSRAAEQRNVTQPAFSRRIRALETWLDVQLFTRNPNNVCLTAAGEKIHGEAEALVRAMYRFRSMAVSAAKPQNATLYFAATHSLSFSFFPSWIKELTHRHMQTEASINLVSDTMASCEKMLMREDVQFLLCHENAGAPSRFTLKSFFSVVVGHDTLSPYAAPGTFGRPLRNLDDEAAPGDWLQYSEESGFCRMMAEHPGIAKHLSGSKPAVTSRLATVLLSMAADGRGIAWLPASLADSAMNQGRLVRAGGDAWDIPMDIRLFRARTPLNPTAEILWRAVCG